MNRVRSRSRGGVGSGVSVFYPTFASGDLIGNIGDSITQNGNFASSTKLSNRAVSWIHWAMREHMSMRHGIWYDATATDGASYNALFRGSNYGFSGYSAPAIQPKTTGLVNLNPELAIVLCGTNTGTAEQTPAAVTFAAIQAIIEELTTAGIYVIVGKIFPRAVDGTGYAITITPTLMQRILDINDMIVAYAATNPLVYVWDCWPDVVDPQYVQGVDDKYGTPLAGFSDDGVHLLTYGAYLASKSLKTLIDRMVTPTRWWSGYSNLFTNPTLTGSGGTASQGVTGSVATSWVVRNVLTTGQNVTGVASLVSDPATGGQKQRVVITSDGLGSSAGNTETIEILPSSVTGLTNGQWYQMAFKVEVSSNSGQMLGALRLQLRNSTTGQFGHALEPSTTNRALDPWPTDNLTFNLVTEAVQWNTGNTVLPRLYIECLENKAGSFQVDVSLPHLIPVDNPSTVYPYTP